MLTRAQHNRPTRYAYIYIGFYMVLCFAKKNDIGVEVQRTTPSGERLKNHIQPQTIGDPFITYLAIVCWKLLQIYKIFVCVWFKILDNKIEHYRISKVRFRPRLVWPIFMSQFTRGLFQSEESIPESEHTDFPPLIITCMCVVLLLLCIFL